MDYIPKYPKAEISGEENFLEAHTKQIATSPIIKNSDKIEITDAQQVVEKSTEQVAMSPNISTWDKAEILDEQKLMENSTEQIDIHHTTTSLGETEISETQNYTDTSVEPVAPSQTTSSLVEPVNSEEIREENTIRLLEERLIVDSKKRKVGDVIVRKEIETRMIEVPVKREKLIIEQISPEHKQLAEINLGQEEISSVELTESEKLEVKNFYNGLTVNGEFSSPKIASLLLNAIALERNHGCQHVKVTILVENESQKQKYQEWFDRCSQGQSSKPEN
ncbi:MAG: YsnF/AvaK domain-containing protein [Desmonostoc vinosum HA7617-LM4]|nr:YsnF/AvaK domain-containing protein [Desmonostoc vinosum HA7617-LM4]